MARLLLPLAVALLSAPATAGTMLVDFLDIGQGDAILVRHENKAVLIDSGDRGSDTIKQLRALGVDRIDLVVSTHPHADHIGRTEAILRAHPIGLYIDNGLAHTTATYRGVMTALDELQVPYEKARSGKVMRMGDHTSFTILNPGEPPLSGTRSDLNSNSVVLQLDHQGDRFLFMGDAEEPTEHRLVREGLERATVLKVAHHGSRHSTSPAFSKAVSPQVAVISVGVDNRYRHPAQSTIDRLRGLGAVVYRTDLSSNVRAISSGHGVEVLEGSIYELGDGDSLLHPPGPSTAVDAPPTPIVDEPKITPDKPSKAQLRAQRRARRRAAKQAKKNPWPMESHPLPEGGMIIPR